MTDISVSEGFDEQELLRFAASAEHGSEHPLGEAIVSSAVERGIETAPSTEFRASPGGGVEAKVKGRQVIVGSNRFVCQKERTLPARLFAYTMRTGQWRARA